MASGINHVIVAIKVKIGLNAKNRLRRVILSLEKDSDGDKIGGYFLRPYIAVNLASPILLPVIMKPTSAAVASAGMSSLSVFNA